MKILFKNLLSFILPITVLILVPHWIDKNIRFQVGIPMIGSAIFIIPGLYIVIKTISSFIRIGKGTLAPWSPTKKLVVSGLYRYMRNPMISGVWITLIGESILFHSLPIIIWAMVFFLINHVYFLVYEEPNLEKRFGEEYREYKKQVPRWLPRITKRS